MDSGQTVYILTQLILGALVTFFAIMLWSRTRDITWMLVIIGTIVAYIEIIHSILGMFGITGGGFILVGSVPLTSFILPVLRMCFFIAAFAIMFIRLSRKK